MCESDLPCIPETDAVVLLSGGIDSTTLLYLVARTYGVEAVEALSLHYGQRHSKELRCAELTCKNLGVRHTVVDVSGIRKLLKGSALTDDIEVPEGHYSDETMKVTVVPNRNMILLSLAMAKAISSAAGAVFYAAHAGDHLIYPDCRPEFLRAIREVAKVADFHQVKIYTPFLEWRKDRIVRLGMALGVDYSLTWSCYKGQEKACGKCGTCVERLEAFSLVGVKDPIEYA